MNENCDNNEPSNRTKYTYDAADRLLKAGLRSFTYDADGNETSETNAFTDTQRAFTFDAANRLVAVNGVVNTSFVYDGDGNRVSQSAGGWTQNYVNDVAATLPVVLQDTYTAGSPSSYVYGLNLIEASKGSDNDFYQYDGLGSVVQLTNAAGVSELSYFYDAWGNSVLPAPPSNPFRFAGQALDSTAGLYYLRARYYDPSIGRFFSQDPSPGKLRMPITLDHYQYSLNNPERFIDPTGQTAAEARATNNSTQLACLGCQGLAKELLSEALNTVADGLGSFISALDTIFSVKNAAEPLVTDPQQYVNKLDSLYQNNAAWKSNIDEALQVANVQGPWSSLSDSQKLNLVDPQSQNQSSQFFQLYLCGGFRSGCIAKVVAPAAFSPN